MIYVFWIICYPISRILDWTVGTSHGTTYRRDELKELVALHGEEAAAGGMLSKDEVTIIKGALDLTNKTVGQVMTEMKYVFSIDYNVKLDRSTLSQIVKAGHSRIPVYKGEKHEIIGIILVKSLILLDPDDATPAKDIRILPLPKVDINTSLFAIMDRFQEGNSHMAIAVDMNDPHRVPKGIITLEDVIEELIQEEIVDETDVFVDMTSRVKVLRALNTGVNGIASNLSLTAPQPEALVVPKLSAELTSFEEQQSGNRKKIFSTRKDSVDKK
jgi:metal transporter CNNM